MTPSENRSHPNWTREERERAASMVGAVRPEVIEAVTGRSLEAVRVQLNRHKVRLREHGVFRNTFTLTRAAEMLGVASETTVRRWIAQKRLHASHRPTIKRQRTWFIRLGDLVEFVTEHPELLSASPPPRTLRDGSSNPVYVYYRPPASDGMLTPKQVARMLGVSYQKVTYHCREGHFPGARKPKTGTRDAKVSGWLIPPSAVRHFNRAHCKSD